MEKSMAHDMAYGSFSWLLSGGLSELITPLFASTLPASLTCLEKKLVLQWTVSNAVRAERENLNGWCGKGG